MPKTAFTPYFVKCEIAISRKNSEKRNKMDVYADNSCPYYIAIYSAGSVTDWRVEREHQRPNRISHQHY